VPNYLYINRAALKAHTSNETPFLRLLVFSFIILPLLLAAFECPLHGEVPPPTAWPDAATFTTPTETYGVETWWHWIYGNITKSGITKDLQAMHEQGISRATIVVVGMGPPGPVCPHLSDIWLDHWQHAVVEADRIGIKLSTGLGPGWSATGGPWIKPENSMKRVVWTHQFVKGGGSVELDLPPLPAVKDWSKDIAVLAWPVNQQPSRMGGCIIQSNGQTIPGNALFDGNPSTGADSEDRTQWNFDFTFPTPYACDRAHFFIRWKEHAPPRNKKIRARIHADGKLIHETEIDTGKFTNAFDLPFPATESTRIRIELEPINAFQFENWATFRQVKIAEVELLSGTESPQWSCALQNLAQQSDDSGSPGTPVWSNTESGSIQADQIIDLTDRVKDGHLSWTAPAGTWRIVRFGYTTTGQKSSVPQPLKEGVGLETDKMSQSATDLHFRSYIKPLIDAIPSEHRKAFDTVLLDSWEANRQNWTDDFPLEFNRRRGYPILPYLPVFAGEVLESRSATERFLNDFRETIGELITERFYGRNAQLLHEQGLLFAAELSTNDLPFLDIFPVARLLDQPMDEFWSDKRDGTILPPSDGPPRGSMVSEAAFVGGKPIIAAESFTSNHPGIGRTPGDYGYLADHAMLWGFNRFTLHSYVHQPGDKGPGWTLDQNGEPFNRFSPWWPMIGSWLQEISRSQYLLQTSSPVYDLLVYYGDSMPRPQIDTFRGLPAGTRLLRIDRVALHQLKVQQGHLTLNGTDRYEALMVPSNRLHAETVETIARIVQDGAVIAAPRPGPAPGWSDHEKQDQRIEALANQIWGPPAAAQALPKAFGKGKICGSNHLEQLFHEINFQTNFTSTSQEGGNPLMTQHRRNGNTELYGLFNPNEKARAFNCTVADSDNRTPEIWNPVTGRHKPLSGFQRGNGEISFPLTVEGRRTVYLALSSLVGAPTCTAAPPSSEPAKTFPITTPFTVTFKGLPTLHAQPLQPPVSWTDNANPEIANYSGIAIYQTSFTLPSSFSTTGQVTLDLGEVGKVARVTLNGRCAGTLWRAPWRLDVGPLIKHDSNTLEIEVANTWINRLLADSNLPAAERTSFTTLPNLQEWLAKETRVKSGLLGEIKLETKSAQQK